MNKIYNDYKEKYLSQNIGQSSCVALDDEATYLQGEIVESQLIIDSDATISFGDILEDPSMKIIYDADTDVITFKEVGIYKVSYLITFTASNNASIRAVLPMINNITKPNYSCKLDVRQLGENSLAGSFIIKVTTENTVLSLVYTGFTNDTISNGVVNVFEII